MLDGYKEWVAGADYVRLTLKPVEDMDALRRLLRETTINAMVTEQGVIPEFTPWSWLGYYGESCSQGSYGTSYQGGILQASGGAAQVLCEVHPPWDSCPRIDLQLTVVYDQDRHLIAQHCADASVLTGRGQGGRSWAVRHINGYGKGDTAYVGSRTSETFVRIYDKSREQGIFRGNHWEWRFEVEFKGKAASAVMSEYQEGGWNMRHAASIVLRTLEKRGIVLPAPVGVRVSQDYKWEVAPTSIDKRLAWFHSQVRPSVEKLIAAGVSKELILDTLGLL